MKILRLTLGWVLVGIPLIYGVSMTLTRVTVLFS